MLHHSFDTHHIGFEKYDYEHNLSCRRGPDNNIPHESYLLPQIEKWIMIIDSTLSYRESNAIGYIVLQPTLFYVEDFVEHTGYMKSQRITTVEFLFRLQLFISQPRLIGK